MTHTIVPTYTATIWVALIAGYISEPGNSPIVQHTVFEIEQECQRYCDKHGLCVTVTPTTFVFTGESQPGVAIGIINYPRYPVAPEDIRAKALALAEKLVVQFGQHRISVVFPDETVMISKQIL